MRSFALNDLLYPETTQEGKIVKQAWFSHNAASCVVAIAGITGVRIRVLALIAGAASLVTFGLWSNASTAVLGNFPLNSTTPLIIPYSPVGWCQFSHGVGVYTYGGAASSVVNGVIIYTED